LPDVFEDMKNKETSKSNRVYFRFNVWPQRYYVRNKKHDLLLKHLRKQKTEAIMFDRIN